MKKGELRKLLLVISCGQQLLAAGQTFQRRYDALNQYRPETALGVEDWESGYIVFLQSNLLVDTLFYGAVMTTLRIDSMGFPVDTNQAFIPLKSTFPGWANVSFRLESGGFGVGGATADNVTNRPALFLLDSLGQTVSIHEYGVTGESWIGRQGHTTTDGGYVICGETSSSGTSYDGFLLKIDSMGNQQWVQTYGSPSHTDALVSVDLAPEGGYYLGGQRALSGTNYDPWVLRVDGAGNILWQQSYSGPFPDPLAQVIAVADGNLVFATGYDVTSGAFSRLRMAKVDSTGGLLWSRLYDSSVYGAVLLAVKEVQPYGDLIAAGQAEKLGIGYVNGVLLRTSANGDSLWLRYYHYYDSLWTEGEGRFLDVIHTSDNGFIAVGAAYFSNNPADYDSIMYSQDTWVVKVDSMGCLVPGCDGISTITSQITNYRDALTISPNPANTSVHVSWALPAALHNKGAAALSIVNAQGKLVRTLPCDLSREGMDLDVSDLAAGIYHLHVVQDGTWITGGKLVVE